jgi:hypothetical protein
MRIEDLKFKIEEALRKELNQYAEIDTFLEWNKIVITATKGPKVGIKIIEVQREEPKKTIIDLRPHHEVKAVETVKKALKVNTDVTYLLTLLEDVKKAAKNLDYKHLTEDAANTIKEQFDKTYDYLQKTHLLQDKT